MDKEESERLKGASEVRESGVIRVFILGGELGDEDYINFITSLIIK